MPTHMFRHNSPVMSLENTIDDSKSCHQSIIRKMTVIKELERHKIRHDSNHTIYLKFAEPYHAFRHRDL
jgi:hypothetical protein